MGFMPRFWQKPIDFFARRVHFVDHMAPIWKALDASERGAFYVPNYILEYARQTHGIDAVGLESRSKITAIHCAPPGTTPVFVSAYGDMDVMFKLGPHRPVIMMEHGVGLTFNHPGYAGGIGLRRNVQFFLAPNQFIARKTAKALGRVSQVVVGTPKLDAFSTTKVTKGHEGKPIVCVSFHWNGEKVCAEAGNAFAHYRKILPELAKQNEFTVIGHGHPKYQYVLKPAFEEAGIEFVEHFSEVMERADVYVNDCSSTMYEFLVTGKPVVIMNAPWFRKDVHFGIRFWDYSNVGPQVEEAEELIPTIGRVCEDADEWKAAREKAVADLYPFLGCSAARAAGALMGFWQAQYK